MNDRKKRLLERQEASALDFRKGLLRPIEEQFDATVCSVEELPEKNLVDMLNFAGVDAFFERKNADLRKVYGISNRVNSAWFKNEPHFSFRFAYWDKHKRKWERQDEYK